MTGQASGPSQPALHGETDLKQQDMSVERGSKREDSVDELAHSCSNKEKELRALSDKSTSQKRELDPQH